MPLRIAVLASGSGTNLQALLDATACGTLEAEVAVVVSDRADAGALRRATAAGVAAVSLPLADRRDPVAREAYDRRLAEVLRAFEPDLIVLAGWMLILTPEFLEGSRADRQRPPGAPPRRRWRRGAHQPRSPPGVAGSAGGARRPEAAIAGTGATVHYVTTAVDSGPVILREEVPVLPDDDEVRLHERIKSVEHRLLPRAVAMALAGVSAANVER